MRSGRVLTSSTVGHSRPSPVVCFHILVAQAVVSADSRSAVPEQRRSLLLRYALRVLTFDLLLLPLAVICYQMI